MNSQELLLQEIYRLKNEITDLKNALDLNREFLNIISAEQGNKDHKTDLLYKIIYRLTQQSNDALVRNVELIHQKNQLKIEFFKVTKHYEQLQLRLEQEIKRNNQIDAPTLSKVAMQQQFLTVNNQLLAQHQQKIHLQEEIERWKVRYEQLQQLCKTKHHELQEQNQKDLHLAQHLDDYQVIPLKKTKLSRKYTFNKTIEQDSKHIKMGKEIRSLKLYIEQLEQKIILFIKAYNLQQNTLERRKSSSFFKNRHPLHSAQAIHLSLLKYAINQIALQQRQNELFMRIKRTYFEGQQNCEVRKDRRTVHSYPKHKEYQMTQQTSDSTDVKLKAENYLLRSS